MTARQALLLGGASLLLAVPGGLAAQEWRTLHLQRQRHDSGDVQVRVAYTGGRFALRPAASDSRLLYDLQLRYDQQQVRPVHRYTAETSSHSLGVERANPLRLGRSAEGEMRLTLSPSAPMALTLDLAAVEGAVALGGMSLRTLAVEAAAGDVQLAFEAPNRVPLERLTVDVSAAHLDLRGLGNARARTIVVRSTAAGVELSFDGSWDEPIEVDARATLAGLIVRIPRDAGVRVDVSRTLGSLEHGEQLVQRDDGLYSRNWDDSTRRITIRGGATLGSISIEHDLR